MRTKLEIFLVWRNLIYDWKRSPCYILSMITKQSNLTHWGQVTHICVSKLSIIGSDNGLSPGRRQAIIWTSAGILLTGTLGTKFSAGNLNRNLYIFIQEHAFENIVWKMATILSRSQCVKGICESWRYDLETLSITLALCEGNPPVTSGFPSQRVSDTVIC